MVLFTVVGQIKTAKRSYFYFCLHNVLHQKNSFEHVQHTFFFNNQHCLDKMQRLFLEVVQEPRPFPSLTKCWEPTKSPRTSLHSGLSEIPLQGGTALENRLKDLKIKDCSWDPSKRKSAAAVHWEKPRTCLFTWWGRQRICWGWQMVLPKMAKHLWSYHLLGPSHSCVNAGLLLSAT